MIPKRIVGFRRVTLNWGESLQALAARELGDAAKWVSIAAINNLAPPYVTGNAGQVTKHVVLYGSTLVVAAESAEIQPIEVRSDAIFLRDVALPKGRVTIEGGDIALIIGRENLKQAIEHRIATEPGELIFHSQYGCDVHKLRGKKVNLSTAMLARYYVNKAILADPRIDKLIASVSEAKGDAIHVEVTAQTVSGHPVDLNILTGG